jgi:hypothetical protein
MRRLRSIAQSRTNKIRTLFQKGPRDLPSHRGLRSVKLGERKPHKALVVAVLAVPQDADGDGLSQQDSLLVVAAVVNAGNVATIRPSSSMRLRIGGF